jgi:hypothetical protein
VTEICPEFVLKMLAEHAFAHGALYLFKTPEPYLINLVPVERDVSAVHATISAHELCLVPVPVNI